MKSTSPVQAPSGASSAAGKSINPWMGLLVLSLLGNGLCGWMLLRRVAPPLAPAAVAAPAVPVARPPAPPPSAAFAAYAALGSYVAESNRIPDLNWSEPQFAAFVNGLRASYDGRGYPMDDDAKRLRAEINARVRKMLAQDQPDPVEDYFRKLREKEHVLRTPSGLHYRITDEGVGAAPTDTSTVLISYSARLPSGESLPGLTRSRVHAAVASLLPGLREGVKLLRPAGKALVYVPANLSFGDGTWPADVPHGAPIVFFLELHQVTN